MKPLGEPALNNAFYEGYVKEYGQQIDSDFKKRIDLFSLLWFLKIYNFELEKIQKREQLISVDQRFPSPEIYLKEIKNILHL